MSKVLGCMIVLLCSLSFVVPSAMAQVGMSVQTIKGDLYVIKDIFRRLVYLHIDKDTKRDRPMVPGEKIEVDVIPGERVIALRPGK